MKLYKIIETMNLSDKRCIPCEGGIPPLNEKEINEYKTYF